MWKPLSVICAAAVFLASCSSMRLGSPSARSMGMLRHGMDYTEATSVLGGEGYELFNLCDQNGDTLQCNTYSIRASGYAYYLLFKNRRLTSILQHNGYSRPCPFRAPPSSSRLPCEDGFASLVQPFSSSVPIQEIDFGKVDERAPVAVRRERAAALAFLPWCILPGIIFFPRILDEMVKSHQADKKLQSLSLGLTYDATLHLLGKPDKALGDPRQYGILVYERCHTLLLGGTECGPVFSCGFRDGKLTWMRRDFDASGVIPARQD